MQGYPIDVSVNPSGAVVGARRVKSELRGMQTLAQSLLKTFAGLFAGAAVAQGIRASIRLLRDYEQEMSTLQAITGATEAQFKSMTEVAKELGITTRFSAQEAAAGMTFLARAGFNAEQSMTAIGPTLQLAQAGGLGLASAADIASNVLKGFRLEVDQTNRVVDIMAKAANSANTNVSQLGNALSFVGPVASGLGLELEQTVAAIGVLSDAGIQGSRAGTGLSRVLAELESPAENTRKIFQAMGVDVANVQPSVVGLSGALEALRSAGIDTGTALEVFGQRGGPAFEVLAASIEDIQTLNEKLENAGGTAARVAAIMDDNLNGAALAFRSSVQGLVIELGDAGLTDALKGLIAGLTEIVRFFASHADSIVTALQLLTAATLAYHGANITMATFMRLKAIPSLIALEKSLGATTTAQALAGLVAKSKLAPGLGLATTAMRALTVAMLANPIGIVAAAIAAVVVLFVKFGDKVKVSEDRLANLHDVATATFQIMMETVKAFTDFFGEAISSVSQFFGENFGFIAEFAQKVFGDVNLSVESVLRFGTKTVDNYLGLWVGLFKAIVELFSNFGNVIQGVFVSALNAAITIVENGVNKTILGLNRLLQAVNAPLVPFASLGRIANDNADAVSDVGKAFIDGFNEVSLVEDHLDRILDRAEEIAATRLNEGIQTSGPLAVNDNDSNSPNITRNAGDLALANERLAIINQTVEALDQEAIALGLLGDERTIYTELLSIEQQIADKLRNSDIELTEAQISTLSKLTESERELISEKQRRNIQLEREAGLLGQIMGPIEEYKNTQMALNSLIENNRISQEGYNAALAQTQLVQSLQNLNLDLGGDFAADARLQQIQQEEDARLLLLQQARDADILNEEQYQALKLAVLQDGITKRLRASRTGIDMHLAQAELLFGSLTDIARQTAGEQSGIYKALFAVEKAIAIARSIVAIQQGIAQAAALPFPANLGAMATVAAATGSIISNIQAVRLQFRDGGIPLPGPGLLGGVGGPREDSNVIRVSRGEGILNAEAVRKNLGLFNALNDDPDFLRNRGFFRNGGAPNPPANAFSRTPRMQSGGDVIQFDIGGIDVNIGGGGGNDAREQGEQAGEEAARAFIKTVMEEELLPQGRLNRAING